MNNTTPILWEQVSTPEGLRLQPMCKIAEPKFSQYSGIGSAYGLSTLVQEAFDYDTEMYKKEKARCESLSIPLAEPLPKERELVEGVDFEIMDTNKWWWALCDNCGWQGSTEHAAGGGAIADTGDYSDPLCPKCFSNKIDEYGEVPSYAGWVAIPIK
ncbi:MAG TPA: hypothetical protein VD794_03885 [Flavisolibacter sp.]|nr:hypothetical protein [Flavisolibacter sp.]